MSLSAGSLNIQDTPCVSKKDVVVRPKGALTSPIAVCLTQEEERTSLQNTRCLAGKALLRNIVTASRNEVLHKMATVQAEMRNFLSVHADSSILYTVCHWSQIGALNSDPLLVNEVEGLREARNDLAHIGGVDTKLLIYATPYMAGLLSRAQGVTGTQEYDVDDEAPVEVEKEEGKRKKKRK